MLRHFAMQPLTPQATYSAATHASLIRAEIIFCRRAPPRWQSHAERHARSRRRQSPRARRRCFCRSAFIAAALNDERTLTPPSGMLFDCRHAESLVRHALAISSPDCRRRQPRHAAHRSEQRRDDAARPPRRCHAAASIRRLSPRYPPMPRAAESSDAIITPLTRR